jgi:anti-anti-sigma regulatory factor
MDSSALQAILAVSQAAAIDGGALALVNPQRAVTVRSVIATTGW